MKYIILCGGNGNRLYNYSLPKPLNYINGRHMIEYLIEKIPSNEIYIIYNIFLQQYNFEEIIKNKFNTKKIIFSCIEYYTRGAVESAFIGLQKCRDNFKNENENLLFIDNDSIIEIPCDIKEKQFDNSFLFYGYTEENKKYSYIIIEKDMITNIQEKEKISNNFCVGYYGFKNLQQFNELAKEMIYDNFKIKNEFYFSQMYKLLIQKGEKITPIFIEKPNHYGSLQEIIQLSSKSIISSKLRICFDIDNTLVTFPVVPGDYTTVKPINETIHFLRTMKEQGHEIILYTARRMKTHNGNVGKVIQDIANITINTLNEFEIPYDEIHFGKPFADIYIDDRAINPYYNDYSLMGFFNNYNNDNEKNENFIQNKIENNKYNVIEKSENVITKIGPAKFIKGEIFFYTNIPPLLQNYFPKYYDSRLLEQEDKMKMKIEFISGIPIYFLYKYKLLSFNTIDKLFLCLKDFHHSSVPEITINNDDIKQNYFTKLKNRFLITDDYPFTNATIIFDEIIEKLNYYYSPEIVSVIHGDFWFSNILLTYQDEIKCIDMKGIVNNTLTLNGDKYYDFGKLYQSILGYDLVLNDDVIDYEYIQKNKEYFLSYCKAEGLNIDYLHWVTKSLIFGTLHFIKSIHIKHKVWNFLQTI